MPSLCRLSKKDVELLVTQALTEAAKGEVDAIMREFSKGSRSEDDTQKAAEALVSGNTSLIVLVRLFFQL